MSAEAKLPGRLSDMELYDAWFNAERAWHQLASPKPDRTRYCVRAVIAADRALRSVAITDVAKTGLLQWLRKMAEKDDYHGAKHTAVNFDAAADLIETTHNASSSLQRFLDAAAGEGLMLDGVDAADLYQATFPEAYAALAALPIAQPLEASVARESLTDEQIDKITLAICTGHMATLALHRKHARAVLAARDARPDPGALLVARALRAYETAFDALFAQCCSNPIKNAWGKPVDMTLLNKAHELAGRALKATEPKGEQ